MLNLVNLIWLALINLIMKLRLYINNFLFIWLLFLKLI